MSSLACQKCGYTTTVASRLKAHLNRKTPCSSSVAAVAVAAADAPETAVVEPANNAPRVAVPDPAVGPGPSSPVDVGTVVAPLNAPAPAPKITGVEVTGPSSQRQIIINCIKVETVDRMHDTIYLLDECIKRPDPNNDVQKGKLFKSLSDFVQIYYSLIQALQYRDNVVKMFAEKGDTSPASSQVTGR